MSSEEFEKWRAYEEISGPIGDRGAWLRHGIACVATAGTWSRVAKRPAEYMPFYNRGRAAGQARQLPRKSDHEMKAAVRAAARAFG